MRVWIYRPHTDAWFDIFDESADSYGESVAVCSRVVRKAVRGSGVKLPRHPGEEVEVELTISKPKPRKKARVRK